MFSIGHSGRVMFDRAFTGFLRRYGAQPCLRIYAKGKAEPDWRVVDLVALERRNHRSGWPFFQGSCTTWSSSVIGVGWEFALAFFEEQVARPASREHPIEVSGGRLRIASRRRKALASPYPSFSEVVAHECGHTAQAIRLGAAYLPLVGSVTLLREGERWWNRWENDASEQGLFGGIAEIVTPIERWPTPG
jgi:hypothetical protein